ncbi:MAG: 4-hydroxy-3-methylbut-2-enyl diphosphate reductase [Candidatus Zixiibacteriota bacterium]
MRVKLAKTAGFCAGVKRAVELVLRSAQEYRPGKMFTWGPLIHNPQVVDFLASRKIFVANDYDELDEGDTVITRSHGIPPSVRDKLRSLDLRICDATCPKVARVHGLVKKYVNQGYRILIFGDEGHAEVNAILGYADGAGEVIYSPEDLDKTHLPDKVCLVAQTTKNVEEFGKVAEKLKKLCPAVIIENTICDATSNRQKEVTRLAKETEAIVVVGGRNSGNTRRLYELARQESQKAFWVETADELREEDFAGLDIVGVTAGASTPHWIISRVVERLELMDEGFSLRKLPFIKNIAYGFVQSNLYAAGAAAMLSILVSKLAGLEICWLCALTTFLYIFSIYNIRSGYDWQGMVFMDPSKIHFFESVRKFLMPMAFLALIAANVTAFFIDSLQFIIVMILSVSTLAYLYGKKMFFHGKTPFPASRDFADIFIWTAIIAAPVFLLKRDFQANDICIFIFIILLAIIRSILNSLKDVDSDRILMRDSIVIYLGERKSRYLAMVFVVLAIAMIATLAHIHGQWQLLLLILPLFMMGMTAWRFSQRIKSSTVLEILIDAWLYIIGILALLG